MINNGYTRKELAAIAQVPFYQIDYLKNLGRLPIIKESTGPGNPTIFDAKAVDVVRKYNERNKNGAPPRAAFGELFISKIKIDTYVFVLRLLKLISCLLMNNSD
ncbi:MAG: hypothetical protein IIA61_03770 [Candidatus Marinimicrobia bacterium]|nr:hypothetical protein [Candidatus Neomarinimicrobiota bacterium]